MSHHLVRDLGYRRALWLYLTSETLTAADARSEGLVTAVVPDADLHVRAAEVAGRLADGPIETFRDGRALLRDAAQTPLAAQMEREFHVLVGALRRPSFRTAAAALRASLRPSGQETTP